MNEIEIKAELDRSVSQDKTKKELNQ